MPSQPSAAVEVMTAVDLRMDAVAVKVESKLVAQGKLGVHSEHMGFLLAEMQSLARAHPQAVW